MSLGKFQAEEPGRCPWATLSGPCPASQAGRTCLACPQPLYLGRRVGSTGQTQNPGQAAGQAPHLPTTPRHTRGQGASQGEVTRSAGRVGKPRTTLPLRIAQVLLLCLSHPLPLRTEAGLEILQRAHRERGGPGWAWKGVALPVWPSTEPQDPCCPRAALRARPSGPGKTRRVCGLRGSPGDPRCWRRSPAGGHWAAKGPRDSLEEAAVDGSWRPWRRWRPRRTARRPRPAPGSGSGPEPGPAGPREPESPLKVCPQTKPLYPPRVGSRAGPRGGFEDRRNCPPPPLRKQQWAAAGPTTGEESVENPPILQSQPRALGGRAACCPRAAARGTVRREGAPRLISWFSDSETARWAGNEASLLKLNVNAFSGIITACH